MEIAATIETLKSAASTLSGQELLRIYWYDGVRFGRPSREQTDLADHRDVKIRLGHINTLGQQKGVDALIVTDLIDLARNGAMADGVLVSGDEDVRIGVQLAQQFGVRVHLVGIEPSRSNQSRSLQQEADTTTEWDRATIANILSYRPPANAPSAISGEADAATLDEQIKALVAALDPTRRAEIVGIICATSKVPTELDRDLLRLGRLHHGGKSLTEPQRSELRATFIRFVQLQ